FSATMAPEIRRLADAFLTSPKQISVSRPATVATTIKSCLVLVNEHDKREALRRLLRAEEGLNALVFCNRKRDVDILLKSLLKHGFAAGALHGDLAQSVRFATLEKFKAGELQILVCSDVAARGIDIGGLSHVFNFDVPHHAEDYVHRIGRTGRAGREGNAITLAAPGDRLAVEAVEKLIGTAIERIEIDGLDPAEWSDEDGRKRGRGPRKDSRERGRGKEREPAREPERKAEAPARPERTPRPERDHDRKPERRERNRPERDRGERDRGERDNGPAVQGFGANVPAFMLIRRRGAAPAIMDEEPGPEDNGSDIAA
ncbi:MAG: DEAD/DEAH box helicase, partial [Rhodospirillales bacterium]|nr:DEAD/DEAH box helicase [Rhodospirillales bacterium]